MTCPKLHIPWPRWAIGDKPNAEQEHENYLALERWADGILKCIPAPGSSRIYCTNEVVGLTFNSGNSYEDSGDGAGITFTLTERSTFAVHLSVNAEGASAAQFYLDATIRLGSAYSQTASANSTQRFASASTHLSESVNVAGTRDAGTYTVYPSLFGETSASTMDVSATCTLTVIIGSDTADDCFMSPS